MILDTTLERKMSASTAPTTDDLSRDVYGVLGIPVDHISMAGALQAIRQAAAGSNPFLVSTPNLNYLIACQSDAEFRKSLLLSDLCPADGMPIIWIARLLGVPIRQRIAGSDIFAALRLHQGSERLAVFLIGGEEGVAEKACRKLNSEASGLECVGAMNPGFGTIEDMSADHVFATINASGARFLAVSIGAKKAQAWLLRNRDRIRVPVRCHLGATINFEAGTVRRAPEIMRRWGLEWLWRIKEEPQLWKRYWADGLALLRLVLFRVVPLRLLFRWQDLRYASGRLGFEIWQVPDLENASFRLSGKACAASVDRAVSAFRAGLAADRDIVADLSAVCVIDARFIGCLLMLGKQLQSRGHRLIISSVSPQIERILRLSGFGYLISNHVEGRE